MNTINPTNKMIRSDADITIFKVGNYGSLLKSQLVVLRKKDRRGISPSSIKGLVELPHGYAIGGRAWSDKTMDQKWEHAYVLLAIASQVTGLTIPSVLEGLRKAHKISLRTATNSFGKTVLVTGASSIGVLNEKLQRGFSSAQPPKASAFGELIGSYAVSRKDICLTPMDVLLQKAESSKFLSFEKPNKLAARLIKLGTEKQEDSVRIGKRDLYLVSTDLQNQSLPDGVVRMLSLGTIWVSPEEFRKMGHIRTIPVKGVTAPLPMSLGSLNEGEWIVGPNSWKSKLNGILYTNLGMSHTEISKMSEEDARSALRQFETVVTIGGYELNAYRISVDCFGTNFYTLYGLDGADDTEEDEDRLTPSAINAKKRGIYGALLNEVSESSDNGKVFDLVSAIKKLINDGTLERKPRLVSITSAEMQQVEISYGEEVSCAYIDSLMTDKNVKSKDFLFESSQTLKSVTGKQVFDWAAKYFNGEAHTIAVPFTFGKFINALMKKLGGKGFVIHHLGHEFIIPHIHELFSTDDGMVDDVPFGLSLLVKMIASLRNPSTQWDRKYVAHTLEVNSYYGNKIQEMKTVGAYLPAISGFWLIDHEVMSLGDKWGKVTAAKLPILFDQAVTSLKNTDKHCPYSQEEMDDYAFSFQYSCFVSQEFFTEQQNDGDGDLIKISKRVDAIPYWSGQISFSRKQVDNYVAGELELKLKLAEYKEMPLTALGEGSIIALRAKEDVARMASNGYKVKALMSRFIRSKTGSQEGIKLARVIAEASAYIVQNESMRAVKHDGGKDSYELVRCQNPESDTFIGEVAFRKAWAKLIKEYFDLDYDHNDKTFIYLVDQMLSDRFGGLGLNSLSAKKLADHLSPKRGGNILFSLMQKGHIRTLKNASRSWLHDSSLKVMMQVIKTAHINFAFTGKINDYATVASGNDCFSYFFRKLSNRYYEIVAKEALIREIYSISDVGCDVVIPEDRVSVSMDDLSTSDLRAMRNSTRDANRLF